MIRPRRTDLDNPGYLPREVATDVGIARQEIEAAIDELERQENVVKDVIDELQQAFQDDAQKPSSLQSILIKLRDMLEQFQSVARDDIT